MRVGGYTLKMAGLREGRNDDYQFGELHLEAYKNGRLIQTLKPERRVYDARQTTTAIGIHSTPKEDLYVVYAGMTEDMRCEVKARVNPLVFWVWAGSALMLLGTLIAVSFRV
jgi:cytochrome c-type biogenesis protein CcmF